MSLCNFESTEIVSDLCLQMKLKYLSIITTDQIFLQDNSPSPRMSFFAKEHWLQYLQIYALFF